MVIRPVDMSPFEFIRVSSLRVAQLVQGCKPRLAPGLRHTTTAQMEVASRLVVRVPPVILPAPVDD